MILDKDTKQPVTGTPEEIKKKIASGQVLVKKGTKSVNIVDADGKGVGSVDIADLPSMLDEGYTIETPFQKQVNDYVDENKGVVGALKVGVGQIADEALLGIPEMIYDKTADPLAVAQKEALKKEHAAANALGGVVGFGATLIPSGGASAVAKAGTTAATLAKVNPAAKLFEGASTVGKAAEKYVAEKLATAGVEKGAEGLAKKVVSSAAGSGAEGLVLATPHTITEAALGDPDDAAETLMAGGLLGGALGAATPFLKKLGKLGKEKMESYGQIKDYQESSALAALGASPAQKFALKDKSPDVVEKLPDFLIGITKDDPKALLNINKLNKRVQDAEEVAGQLIGSSLKKFDEKLMPLYTVADDVGKAEIKTNMFNFQTLKDKITDNFIKPFDGRDLYAAQVNKAKALVQDIDNTMLNRFGGDYQPLNFSAVREYQQELKKLISDSAYAGEQGVGIEALKMAREDIQSYFKELTPKLKEAYPELKGVAEEFKRANDQFRVATSVSDIISKAAERADGKQLLGLRELMSGAGGAATGLGPLAGIAVQKVVDYGKKLYDVGGLLLTEQQFKNVGKKLNDIGSSLSDYGRAAKSSTIVKISDITGNSEDDDYDKLSEKIVAFNQAPEASKLVEDLESLGATGAPQISEQAKIKTADAMNYLANLMPKPLTPNNPLVKNKKYKPSDMEMAKFNRQLKTALDPFSAIEDLNNNTLTKEQVQVLADLYPGILSQIQSKVYDAVAENPQEVPYNKRIKLSLLLGMDLDPSLDPTTANIIMGTQDPAGQEQNQQEPQGNPNAKFESYPTEVQRITNGMK